MLALVLLRLAVGWHFLNEGLAKLGPSGFSAEPFLLQAKGPLAPYFHAEVPGFHRWRELLATPRADVPLSDEEQTKLEEWQTALKKKTDEAKKNKQPIPVELPPVAAYQPWADEILSDWSDWLGQFKEQANLDDAQSAAAEGILRARTQDLVDYLAENEDGIIEYRHELGRLESMDDSPAAGELPYLDERIALKRAETNSPPYTWIADIQTFETTYIDELRNLLKDEEALSDEDRDAINAALAGDDRLPLINQAVTWVVLGVGVLLLAGFFTRIASLVGGLFLLSVVATQPPWVAGADPVYYQVVELMALGVLFATGAGRWAGLDFFTYSLWNKCCGRSDD